MMIPRSNSKLIKILTHVLVWAAFGLAIFFRYPIFTGMDISYQLWITQIATFSLLVIAFYVNSSVLVPELLLKNNIVIYFSIVIAIIAAIVFVNGWGNTNFAMHLEAVRPDTMRLPRLQRPPLGRHIDTLTLIISALVLVIGTSITVMQKWQQDKQERDQLEKDKLSSELAFLKTQINPHFFFNTLNNIYALTRSDADKAGKAIHQLSRMMRYLLYETQEAPTMLSQEIEFVQDYISLMQLRLTEAVRLIVTLPLQLQDTAIAPMILMPFVENAFKHGVSAMMKSHVNVDIQQENSKLDVHICNSIIRDNNTSLDRDSGIGLLNTRRRLDLLYPGKYSLETGQNNAATEYSVHLILDLS